MPSGRPVGRVARRGILKQAQRRTKPCLSALMPKCAPQIEKVNLWIDTTRHCGRPGVEGLVDRLGDRPGNFVLQGEDIRQLTIIALCPEIFVGLRLNEPGRNAHPVASAENRPFHDRVDA